jgi:hypothetical protein
VSEAHAPADDDDAMEDLGVTPVVAPSGVVREKFQFELVSEELMAILEVIPDQPTVADIGACLRQYQQVLAAGKDSFAGVEDVWEEFKTLGKDREEFCNELRLLCELAQEIFDGYRKDEQSFLPSSLASVYVRYGAITGRWQNFFVMKYPKEALDIFTIRLPAQFRGDVLVSTIKSVNVKYKLDNSEWYDRFYWAAIDMAKYLYDMHARLSPRDPQVANCASGVHCLRVLGMIRRSFVALNLHTKESLTEAKELVKSAEAIRDPGHESDAAEKWPSVFPTITSWTRQLKTTRMPTACLTRWVRKATHRLLKRLRQSRYFFRRVINPHR